MTSTFEALLKCDKPLLVDFFATWCGPCQMMHPVLEELHAKVGDKIKIIKIDIDKNENIALKYNIRSVPTLMLFINGEMRWRESGAMSCDRLLEILNQHAAF
jgi:thioredoxin 1